MRTHRSFGALKALMLLAGCRSAGLVASTLAGSEDAANQLVGPDLFGELVEVVTPGYPHWSKASGDTVDPQGDRDDLDNSFGDHAGAVDAPTSSSQAKAYARGSVAEEAVYPETGRTPVPSVERLGSEGVAGARVSSQGADDLFLFATGAKPVSASNMDTDARIVAIGREGGKVAWFLAIAGTRLEVDGQRLFEADRPVAAAFDATLSGCIVSDGPATVTLRFGQDGAATLRVEAGASPVKQGRK